MDNTLDLICKNFRAAISCPTCNGVGFFGNRDDGHHQGVVIQRYYRQACKKCGGSGVDPDTTIPTITELR